MVRRLKLARFTQLETTEFLQHVLGGESTSRAPRRCTHRQRAWRSSSKSRPHLPGDMADPGDRRRLDARPQRRAPGPVRRAHADPASRGPVAGRDEARPRRCGDPRPESASRISDRSVHLGADDLDCDPTVPAESLAPAVQAGLLVEHPANYLRTSASRTSRCASSPPMLNAGRRRAIHAALVDLLTADGDPPPASLSLWLNTHSQEAIRTVPCSSPSPRLSSCARRPSGGGALRGRPRAAGCLGGAGPRGALTPGTTLSTCRVAPPTASKASRSWPPWPRLWGTRPSSASSCDALRHCACRGKRIERPSWHGPCEAANARGDHPAELAACLELGQNLLRSPLGESFGAPRDVDLDRAEEAYARACELAGVGGRRGARRGVTRARRDLDQPGTGVVRRTRRARRGRPDHDADRRR